MKKIFIVLTLLLGVILMNGCTNNTQKEKNKNTNTIHYFTRDSKVYDVIENISFSGFGNLIFPMNRQIDKDMTLEDVGDIYVWYNYINPDKTVEIVNFLKQEADSEKKVFYNIYTEEERKQDPEKRNTGIFYFRGNPNSKFAILNAGGGFMYVGAMQDSFPHSLELSKNGYNAFALIYRPDADKAMEDLARAVAFIHDHAKELQVDTSNYSVWERFRWRKDGSMVRKLWNRIFWRKEVS